MQRYAIRWWTARRHAEPRKTLIVVDEALAKAQPTLLSQINAYFKTHSDCLNLVCEPVVMEGGERTKNSYFHVSEAQSQVDRYHIDRHSYLICVGGGALARTRVVGLAAATAHRGIRHIRIPTTTLSQDDSGVGVKNGINAFGKKNFIGTFAPPFAVINDFQLLSTTSARDKRNGYVEAVKVACIRDAEFFRSHRGRRRCLGAIRTGGHAAADLSQCRAAHEPHCLQRRPV